MNSEQNQRAEQDAYRRRRFLSRTAKSRKQQLPPPTPPLVRGGARKEEEKNPYKYGQVICTCTEIFSAFTSMTGVSAVIFIVVAHGEWLFSKLVPAYKFPNWKKIVIPIVDLIIFIMFVTSIIIFNMMPGVKEVDAPVDPAIGVTETGEEIPMPIGIGI